MRHDSHTCLVVVSRISADKCDLLYKAGMTHVEDWVPRGVVFLGIVGQKSNKSTEAGVVVWFDLDILVDLGVLVDFADVATLKPFELIGILSVEPFAKN